MNHMKRRLLTMLIALAMMLTYMPGLAFADEGIDAAQVNAEEIAISEELNAASVTYSDWGAWSAWQDAAVSGSDIRQVETRDVVDSYTMASYCYTDPSSRNSRGYWPSASQSYVLRRGTVETWPKAWVDSARWVIGAGTFYDSPDNDNCDGLIHDGTAYVVVHGQGHDYVPFFITGTNYKKQYRYRDRSVIDTPEPENPSNPSNPSNPDAGSVISDSTVTEADISDVRYTGKGVRPSVRIIINGITLVEGTDYTVTCRNNKKIGKATIIITGCGRYSGSITRTFNIVPKGCSLKSCKSKKGSGQCTVTWKKGPKGCSGYIVRYSTDPNFGSYKIKTVKGKNKTSCTLKKLTKGETYYVQVCVYKTVKKTKYCSGWSNCKSIKIKKITAKKGKIDAAEARSYICISEDPVKVGKYYYKNSDGNILRSKRPYSGYKNIIKPGKSLFSNVFTNGKYIYTITEETTSPKKPAIYKLIRYDASGKNKKTIRKLPFKATEWGGWYLQGVYSKYILLKKWGEGSWNYEMYRCSIKSKKLKLIATNCAVFDPGYNTETRNGEYLIGKRRYHSDVRLDAMDLYKRTSSCNLIKLLSLGEAVSAAFVGDRLYYVNFDRSDLSGEIDVVKGDVFSCNRDGTNLVKIGTFTKYFYGRDVYNDYPLVQSIGNESCYLSFGTRRYMFIYSTGELKYIG